MIKDIRYGRPEAAVEMLEIGRFNEGPEPSKYNPIHRLIYPQ